MKIICQLYGVIRSNARGLSKAPMFDSISALPRNVQNYIIEKAKICLPDKIKICDGSTEENKDLISKQVRNGSMKNLPKYENCWLVRTDPADVARVESKTFIATQSKRETIPDIPESQGKGKLGNWMSLSDMDRLLGERYPGCMKGRVMYVIPFSMGPVNGPLSKIGIQLTDSPYVVCSMKIMTRMGQDVVNSMTEATPFVKALHSVGVPLPTEKRIINGWPCNPEKTIIAHYPDRNEICSFGSGYGGNSLLGKKCFALRLGSILARNENWLAEHMLILGLTPPNGKKIYVTAAFPSACGKTNLAMLQPTIPGYRVECVGDDIAWMKFDSNGVLRAINPEAGFFGVAPGTSHKTNPNAMACIQKNSIFTNVAETSDGGYYWEGLEDEVDLDNVEITDWEGKPWKRGSGKLAAHPNSRFCCPASQCPIIDSNWESPEGVPISAIIFGGRRPRGVPLIYEAFNWQHGVFTGACLRSESTAAAEHKGKVIMNDPFAMRPFFGYNFGDYLRHWLSLGRNSDLKLPRIFHVNWFRKALKDGSFLWPGYGENSRVLDWIAKRISGEAEGQRTPIGIIPKYEELNLDGLDFSRDQFDELFGLPVDFWTNECIELERYFNEQVGQDLPQEIIDELKHFQNRL